MALDEPKKDEKPVQINGIDVLIEDFAQSYVGGTTVDYVKTPYGEGFILDGAGRAC